MTDDNTYKFTHKLSDDSTLARNEKGILSRKNIDESYASELRLPEECSYYWIYIEGKEVWNFWAGLSMLREKEFPEESDIIESNVFEYVLKNFHEKTLYSASAEKELKAVLIFEMIEKAIRNNTSESQLLPHPLQYINFDRIYWDDNYFALRPIKNKYICTNYKPQRPDKVDVVFDGFIFNQKVSFDNSVFGADINLQNISKPTKASFKNCYFSSLATFNKVKNVSALYFENTYFNLDIQIQNSNITNLSFIKCDFNSMNTFSLSKFSTLEVISCKFQLDTYFSYIEFGRTAIEDTTFLQTHFMGCTFHENTNFKQTKFEDFTKFSNVKFKKNFSFYESVIDQPMTFDEKTEFHRPPLFSKISGNGVFDPSSASFEEVMEHNFKDKPKEYSDFLSNWLSGQRDSKQNRLLFQKVFFKNSSLYFCQLKREMEERKQHDAALTFFAFELKCRAEASDSKLYKSLIGLYEDTCDFGRSIKRPAIAWAYLWFSMICVYSFYNGNADCKLNITAFQHSTYMMNPLASAELKAITKEFLEAACYNGAVDFAHGVQRTLSTIFLFLIGLGIRNKLRIG